MRPVIARFKAEPNPPRSQLARRRLHGAVVLLVLGGLPLSAEVFQWDFNGDLTPTTRHQNLQTAAAAPATLPDVTFTAMFIGSRTARMARFSRGTYFRVPYGLAPNGGGSLVNQYTLVLDVMFPDRSPSSGWAALCQTSRDNTNDGDWFINPASGLGISGNYGGSVPAGEWHRLALAVDLVAGTFVSYIDGVEVQRNSGLGLDGRFALYTDGLLLFADEDQENAAGLINSFQFHDAALPAAAIAALGGPSADGIPLEENPPPPVEPGLTGQWTFDPAHVSGQGVLDAAGGRNGAIHGSVALTAPPAAMAFDGATNYVTLGGASEAAVLPRTALSAEAWVALDSGTRWGGIIGYMQDNGDFEKGWVLGYNSSSFSMAVSTAGRLTYLDGATAFEPGRWYHVAGTYDGSSLKLYVDGRLDGSSSARSGPIDYAAATFVIGTYQDDNEFFPLDGRIHEVRFHDRALSAAEVLESYQAQASLFPTQTDVCLGPYATFVAEDAAVISWETGAEMASIVEYGASQALDERAEDSTPTRFHEIRVGGLERDTPYFYAIKLPAGAAESSTATYEFSTEFNFAPPDDSAIASPYPADALAPIYARAAEHILSATGVRRGYCLDYGCGDGRLAFELAVRSELQIVGVAEDTAAVGRARALLKSTGLYGARITIHERPLSALPYTSNCFNLIVSDHVVARGEGLGDAAEMLRVLRPAGGTLYAGQPGGATIPLSTAALDAWLGAAAPGYGIEEGPDGLWARYERAPLAGAGEWTHMYGDPGQSASSGDTLVRGRDMRLQWFGQPGPRGMIDRQSRNQAPLTANGRLFVQGDNRIFAQDAYNGMVLWTLELPNLRRVNIARDTGNLCADGDAIYMAMKGDCWRLDGDSGEITRVYSVGGAPGENDHTWGYLAVAGDQLYGSRVKMGSHYTDFKGPDKWYDATAGGFGTAMVTSDELFSLRKDDGSPVWTYASGVILNSSVSIGGGRIYFVESRNAGAVASASGRIGASQLWQDQHMVALDARTGALLWDRSVTFPSSPLPVVFFLCYSQETLVASLTTTQYYVQGFAALDGAPRWSRNHAWNRDNHGGHMYHPVIVDGRVYVEPRSYDLAGGAVIDTALPVRGGCSTMSAAAHTLHYVDWDYHNGSFIFWDLDSGQRVTHPGSRASCWLSIISGGGMILSPTASSGCTCRYPVQTSIGYGSW